MQRPIGNYAFSLHFQFFLVCHRFDVQSSMYSFLLPFVLVFFVLFYFLKIFFTIKFKFRTSESSRVATLKTRTLLELMAWRS